MLEFGRPFVSTRPPGDPAFPGLRGRGSGSSTTPAPWSPAALFAAGEQGAWYDPSDLSTMFQDAAGTIPVTGPDQPVGLMLDKSAFGGKTVEQFIADQPEMALDPDFNDADVWTAAPEDAWVVAGGKASSNTGMTGNARMLHQPAVNKFNRLEFHQMIVERESSSPLLFGFYYGSASRGNRSVPAGVGVDKSLVVVSDVGVAPHRLALVLYGVQQAVVSRVSVKAVPGNHLTQATSSARPILRTDGTLWWIEGDGFDDFLSTGLLGLSDEFLISCGMRILSGGGAFPGPWRFLREGGDPVATAAALLEEYRDSSLNSRRKAVVRRYPSAGAIYDSSLVRPAFETTSHVSWVMQRGASARQGVIYPGTAVADTAATRQTIGGSSTLDLFRGYSGNFMKGNFYGGVFLMRAPTDEEIALTNGWTMQKTGATL